MIDGYVVELKTTKRGRTKSVGLTNKHKKKLLASNAMATFFSFLYILYYSAVIIGLE